jgi:antitoxin (DNA-binding transcriptional repressor) of toxin-antitoxin stability system
VRQAQAGCDVVVLNDGRPVARIVGYSHPTAKRRPGLVSGRISIERGFDELPEGFADAFGGA